MKKIQVRCEKCSAELALPVSSIGQMGRCPKCQLVFLIQDSTFGQTDEVPVEEVEPQFAESNPYAAPVKQPKFSPSSRYSDSNPPPLGMITIPLYISAALYFLIGIGGFLILLVFLASADQRGEWLILLFFGIAGIFICLALSAFIVFFTGKLKKRKKWAWIAAIVFGVLYAPSAFIFLGVPILLGALKSDVQDWFTNQ